MSSDFVSKNVTKIFKDKKFQYPLNMAYASTWILANTKGINLKVLDVAKRSSLADYFVLASASNPTQAEAMSDTICFQMKQQGYLPKSVEGRNGADWILIDLGDVIVHIFQESVRPNYDLESLYSFAKPIPIPEEYYFPESQTPGDSKKQGNDDENYF